MLMLFAALLLVLLPAAALAPLIPSQRDPVVTLTGALAGALALHIVGFWWLRWMPLGLATLGCIISGAATALALLRWRRLRDFYRQLEGVPNIVWWSLLGVLAVRLWLLIDLPVPPGADMSMHAYMGRIILEADGVPRTHLPILPIDDFGTYAAGLPSLAAELTAISGATIAKTSLLLIALFHWLLTGTIYAFARRITEPNRAMAVALICTICVRDPQHHVLWGGNPTVMALLFAAWGIFVMDALLRRNIAAVIFGAILLAAAPTSHAVIPYVLIYLLPPSSCSGYGACRRTRDGYSSVKAV